MSKKANQNRYIFDDTLHIEYATRTGEFLHRHFLNLKQVDDDITTDGPKDDVWQGETEEGDTIIVRLPHYELPENRKIIGKFPNESSIEGETTFQQLTKEIKRVNSIYD